MCASKWLLSALLLTECALAGVAQPSNIILITLDTARADRMGFLGSKRGLTPNLDKLAQQSVVFSRAYAHVPLTVPSHATILTGTYPQFNEVEDMGARLAPDLPYLPAILHEHGYRTAAFVASQVLDPKSVAAPGFDRGFDVYDAGFHSRRPGEDRYHSVERRGDEVIKRATAWLVHQQSRPFFLWIHLYDPHDPYDPPPPFKNQYAAAPYDGEIAYADAMLGKLFTTLRTLGLYHQAVIAFMGDHGEALGEHGERGHGIFLYDETIHVPFVLKSQGAFQGGLRVDSRVGLVDVAPTVLQEVGITVPPLMQGHSLVEISAGRRGMHAPPDRPAYAQTEYPHHAFGWSPLRALRKGKYLFIQAPERELYDQSLDPGASHNLARGAAAVADTLSAELDSFHQTTSGGRPEQALISPELAEKLQALGYVPSDKTNESTTGGADPKRRIETANLLHEGLLDVEEEHYREAIPRLTQVLKDQPRTGLAALALGQAFNRLENYQEALPWLKQAVELSPESGRAHNELGLALAETGDLATAATEFESALKRAPDSEELHFQLATTFERLARVADARREYEATLRLAPDHFDANLLLGRLLGMQNEPNAALPYLQKAVKLQPQSADAHKFLANVYLELGDQADARREQAQGERLKTAIKH